MPGIAHANSKPPSPAARARWSATAFAAPPPARSTLAVDRRPRRARPSSLRTSASTPSSATSRFEPRPTVATASPRSAAQRSSSSTSATVSGRANARAGPPVPSVVKRASSTPSSIVHASASSSSGAARSTSPAPSVSTVSPGARPARRRARRAVLERRRPADAHARAHARELVDDQPAGHAGQRLLARRVDLGDADRVRGGERDARTRARGAACASRGAAGRARARGRRSARRRGRPRAPPDGARSCRARRRRPPRPSRSSRRPAPANSTITRSASARGDARELERGERGGGVAAVVLARHRELELDGLELLGAHDLRHVREPLLEERRHLGARAERRVVVEVDVQEDRDLGPERGDRAVGLVALDDEPARAGARVAAELRDLAADQERGIEAEPVEAERDHRARRRLAVRAGDDDRAAQRDELGEQVGARPALDAAGERGRDVRPPSRRAAAAARARSSRRSPSRWARYGVSTRSQPATSAPHACASERVRAHAGAADPGDPDAPTGERLRARRAHRRSCRRRRASRRRASPSPIVAQPRRVGEQLRRRARGTRVARVARRRRSRAPPARSKYSAFRALVVGRRVRVRHEDRGPARRPRSPRPSRPRARRRGRRRRAPRRSRRRTAAAGSPGRDTRPRSSLVVALAAEVQHGGPARRPTRRPRSRSACARPRLPPKTSTTGPSCGSPSARRASSRGDRARASTGSGRPTTRALPSQPGDRVREEEPPRERRREPVREAEVRVGLGQRGRDPPQPRGEHHRPGDVAAAAEHDVGPAPREDAQARGRRRRGEPERARRAAVRAGAGSPRRGTRRTRSRAQERAAPRRDPATRRTSLPLRARAALPPPRATGRRAPPFPRLRSGTAAVFARPWPRAMLRRMPTDRRAMTRLEPP